MASKLNTIKTRIQTILEALVREDILRDVQVDDFKKAVFNRDFSKFPVAILTTPTVESGAATNTQNLRSYLFEILVLSNADEVKDAAQIEDLIENILNEFDNDPTLKADQTTGAADGGVEPSTSAPEALSSGGNNYIAFSVLIRAKAIRDLTFV